jgi:hypothetical protein
MSGFFPRSDRRPVHEDPEIPKNGHANDASQYHRTGSLHRSQMPSPGSFGLLYSNHHNHSEDGLNFDRSEAILDDFGEDH